MEAQGLLLGTIVRLQIQTAALKTGVKPDQRYSPDALLAVETLTLTPEGAEARGPEGERVLDIHHARHPATRQMDGENALSFGFTSHYAAIQARFGPGLALGGAGENILIAAEREIPLAEVAAGLWIRSAPRPARLEQILPAAPCVPFTRYLLRGPADGDTLKPALQFLNAGRRGFYARLAGAEALTVSVGDQVFTAAQPGGRTLL